MGVGNKSHTCDVQNGPKNIFFGPELNEIQPISLNWLFLLQFLVILEVLGLILMGKPM
jgi:hypothetical protein